MTICYFGIYKSSYTRNAVLIKGLKQNGVEIIECNVRGQKNKNFQLIKKYWPIRKKIDVIIIGFPGHAIVPLAWLLAKLSSKKVIFDAFVSMYDSVVFDRAECSPKSFKGIKYWLVDWLACHLADLTLLDAQAHADYFIQTFKIKPNKFKVILVGVDDEAVQPAEQKKVTQDFLVHFHGTYIPAQGIPYIIQAAELLKNEPIQFNLVGKLDHYNKEIKQAQEHNLKVNFFDFMPYDELIDKIKEADICLGMFGDTDKAKRAGAFKIVEAMAMCKAFITADTPAMQEFLVDGQDCLFCKVANAKDLADKILELKNNPQLKEQLADNGYKLYKHKLTPQILGKQLKQIINQII